MCGRIPGVTDLQTGPSLLTLSRELGEESLLILDLESSHVCYMAKHYYNAPGEASCLCHDIEGFQGFLFDITFTLSKRTENCLLFNRLPFWVLFVKHKPRTTILKDGDVIFLL